MIREFENYLRSIRGYSENTIRAYMSDLKNFVLWVRTHKECATWSTIAREDIDEYMAELTRRELKPSTINRMLASVSALYRYMQREGYEVENPCKYESRKKMPTTIPDTIPVKKIAQAYKHARGVKKHMLGILATTGLRIQEMLDIRYEDIDFESSTIKVTGKGSKERLVTTDKEVLADYKKCREEYKASGKIFFYSQRSARYLIYEALRPYCEGYRCNPHTLRHTYATELAKNGENCATIAKILGHSHIETSQKYINLAEVKKPARGISLT